MTNCKAEKEGNKNMNILSLLASDNYIVINRDLLKKYGINVTLMLCELASEYNYFYQNGKLEDGMFYSTIDNINERTGLSKYQQSEALKVLDKIGIVKSVVKGIPAKRFFKIDVEELAKQIVNISPSSCKEIGKLDGEKVETKNNNRKLINNSNNKINKNNIGDSNAPQSENSVKSDKPKRKKFVIPTVEDVQAYCDERGNNIDAQHFIDYYSARGWMLVKSHIKDWKACVRTWERNDSFKPKQEKQPEKKYDQNGYGSEEEFMAMFYGK
jgi:hypothetical protein|nr:MAG TPA: Replication initiator A family protein [Caudoviricetes sp.]